MLSIFDFKDYVKYLAHYRSKLPKQGHGFKLAIAKELNCQSTYISQIFKDSKLITLEHADQLNPFLEHNPDEANYFLLMVQYKRSGSQSLANYFLQKMETVKAQQLKLNKRLKVKTELKEEDCRIYYSSWVYSAIHIFLTTSNSGVSADNIATKLNITKPEVNKVLNFLLETGLAIKKMSKYICGPSKIHLSDSAPEIKMHHTNWRLKAITSVAFNHEDNLHYSSVVSLSHADIFKIKNTLIKMLREIKSTIKDSEPETLSSFNIDFFSLEN